MSATGVAHLRTGLLSARPRGMITVPDEQDPAQTRFYCYQRTRPDRANLRLPNDPRLQCREHPIPADRASQAQRLRRGLFREAVREWQQMSEAERAPWEAEGRRRQIAGYHAFISYVLSYDPEDRAVEPVPPLPDPPPGWTRRQIYDLAHEAWWQLTDEEQRYWSAPVRGYRWRGHKRFIRWYVETFDPDQLELMLDGTWTLDGSRVLGGAAEAQVRFDGARQFDGSWQYGS